MRVVIFLVVAERASNKLVVFGEWYRSNKPVISNYMAHITFVKKILLDGELCKKCAEVSERLERDGLLDSINQIAIAELSDPESEGMRLASRYKVSRAPFFLVEEDDGTVLVFDIYFKLKKYLSSRIEANPQSHESHRIKGAKTNASEDQSKQDSMPV